MPTDRHREINLIDKLLAGGASQQEERGLRDHLCECAQCQEYMDASNRAIKGLSGFSFEVGPSLNARVQSAITQRVHRVETARSKRTTLTTFAAALVLTVVGSAVAWNSAGYVASHLSLTANQFQLGLLILWILPSALISVLIPIIPRSVAGQLSKEGRTA